MCECASNPCEWHVLGAPYFSLPANLPSAAAAAASAASPVNEVAPLSVPQQRRLSLPRKH